MCKKDPCNTKKIWLKSMIILCLILIFIVIASKVKGRENPQCFLEGMSIMEQQVKSIGRRQGQLCMKEEIGDKAEEGKKESDEEFPEVSLVEQISNPRLKRYPWTTPGLIEEPYHSYAQVKKLELAEFECIPQDNLEPEEAAEWGEEILCQLVLEPERVSEYGAVLTVSSVEAWENFQWIYANPKDYYRSKFTEFYSRYAPETGYYVFYTYVRIPEDYFGVDNGEVYNNLDRTYADGVERELIEYLFESYGYLLGEDYTGYNIGIELRWKYERDSGLIQVEKIDYQLL